MSFFTNLFSSSSKKKKLTPEEIIQATSVQVTKAVLEAIKHAPKTDESKKRAAEDEASPKKQKEPKKRRVEDSAEAPTKPTEVKPSAEQEPVLLSSRTAPSALSLLTEREVACLSAEEARRTEEEANKYLQTLVMNKVRLEHHNEMQQALKTKVDKLLGAITGTPKPPPKPKTDAGPPRVTCAAINSNGRRCRRKPFSGSNRCTEHDGDLALERRPAATARPAARPAPKPAASKPSSSKPAPSKAAPSKPSSSKPGPPSRRAAEESQDSESEWVDSDIDD